jgi:hypothetical protein
MSKQPDGGAKIATLLKCWVGFDTRSFPPCYDRSPVSHPTCDIPFPPNWKGMIYKASATRVQRIYGPHQICDLRRVQYTCQQALILSKVGIERERERR